MTQTSFPQTEAMPNPWARGYALDKQRNWQDVSNTVPVAFMWSAGAMISDMADIRRWIKLYATGKASGAATYHDLINCIPFLGTRRLAWALPAARAGTAIPARFRDTTPPTITRRRRASRSSRGSRIRRRQPVEGVASVMVRDIARIITPAHVPFVYGSITR